MQNTLYYKGTVKLQWFSPPASLSSLLSPLSSLLSPLSSLLSPVSSLLSPLSLFLTTEERSTTSSKHVARVHTTPR